MQCSLVICLFVLAGYYVVTLASDVPTVEKCKPGTYWKEHCNSCFCLDQGVGACTKMLCNGFDEDLEKAEGKYCLPSSSWKSKCNSCNCASNGIPICTHMACPDNEKEPWRLCAPNTTWKNNCNICWCMNGLPACTSMACGNDLRDE